MAHVPTVPAQSQPDRNSGLRATAAIGRPSPSLHRAAAIEEVRAALSGLAGRPRLAAIWKHGGRGAGIYWTIYLDWPHYLPSEPPTQCVLLVLLARRPRAVHRSEQAFSTGDATRLCAIYHIL